MDDVSGHNSETVEILKLNSKPIKLRCFILNESTLPHFKSELNSRISCYLNLIILVPKQDEVVRQNGTRSPDVKFRIALLTSLLSTTVLI